MQFKERTPLEKGFAERFESDVKPALLGLENRRIARLKAMRVQIGLIALLSLGAAVILYGIFSDNDAWFIALIAPPAVGFGLGQAAYKSQLRGWQNSVGSVLMPSICSHIGDLQYSSTPAGRFPVDTMRDLRILEDFNRSDLRHFLSGLHRDVAYSLIHAHLKYHSSGKNSSTRTVFKGILFRIAVPEAAPGRIVIIKDIGKLGNRLGAFFSGNRGRGLPRVAFDHPQFEAAFEVYADAPGRARKFMPPAFLDILLSIGQREGGRRGARGMAAAFRDKWFYLALSQDGDFMQMGSLETPVRDMERDIHSVFYDIGLAFRIIDHLHGDKLRPPLPHETGITR